MKIIKNFIKDQDISIYDIEKRLNQVATGIKSSNKLNLNDINIICEEIFGNILNKLLALNLISVSAEVSGNYIAVDLVDFDHSVAFQITSRSDRNKIKDTIQKFNHAVDLSQIRSLNILILGESKSYCEPVVVKLGNGEHFSYNDNVFDNAKLLTIIEQKERMTPGILVEIYDTINMVFDSGRLKYRSIVNQTKQLTGDNAISYREQKCWKKGYGDIQLTAFIPLAYDEKMSCLLEFRKAELSDAYITIEEKELLADYFLDEEAFIAKHNVGRYEEEDEMFMQISHVRILTNAHTSYHLFQLFEELNREYQIAQAQIEECLGTAGLKRTGSLYLINTISPLQWHEMLYFSRAHDWFSDEADFEWNIFNNNANNNQLILSPHVKDKRITGIFAELIVKKSETKMDMLDLFWKPGYRDDKNSMEGFDNVIKWRADYTSDWVRHRFLPKAHEFYCARNEANKFSWRCKKQVVHRIKEAVSHIFRIEPDRQCDSNRTGT